MYRCVQAQDCCKFIQFSRYEHFLIYATQLKCLKYLCCEL
nr:MAG TPA: hypothetical protein [Caudoviricetes sp.]